MCFEVKVNNSGKVIIESPIQAYIYSKGARLDMTVLCPHVVFFTFIILERHCARIGRPCAQVCEGSEWESCGAEMYRVCPTPGSSVHH